VSYERQKPNPDLALSTSFVRLELPSESADGLMRELGMRRRGEDGETDFFLTSGWHVSDCSRPTWFDIEGDEVEGARAGAFGVNGWLVGGYHDGALYLLATDSGHLLGTPGPW
jgi:hypothetical protein